MFGFTQRRKPFSSSLDDLIGDTLITIGSHFSRLDCRLHMQPAI
jgi:hypothetical protein